MLQQKAQNLVEVAGGTSITLISVLADITELVQAIGVWAGTSLALIGLYHAIKREIKNRDK